MVTTATLEETVPRRVIGDGQLIPDGEPSGLDDQQLVPVMRAIYEALKRNPHLEMKDLDTRLAEFAQEVPQEEIDKGKAEYDEGVKAMTSLDLSTAIKKLTAAGPIC